MDNQEKKAAIIQMTIANAKRIVDNIATIPKTGKGRNIFIKKYNRRPQTKKKVKMAIVNISISTVTNAMQLAQILSTPSIMKPSPKYKEGILPVGGINREGIEHTYDAMEYAEYAISTLDKFPVIEERQRIPLVTDRTMYELGFREPIVAKPYKFDDEEKNKLFFQIVSANK